MFRVKREAAGRTLLWTVIGLLIVMVAVAGTTIWLVVEIHKEQRAILRILAGGVAEDIQSLGTLPEELPWQFRFTMLLLLVLIAAGIALVFVVRRYLMSETSLRNLKMLAWDILASMDLGVITTDREGTITSVNPRAEELLGVDFDCVGHPLADICRDAEPLAEQSRDVLMSGVGQHDRDFSVTRNGHTLRLRAEGHVLRGTDTALLGTVLHICDMTERILIEERMRRMERFMGLGTLAAGLHHEIKNPLSGLSLHVQLLEERLERQSNQETAEHFGVLKTEVTRIAGVLETFRDYASVERLHRSETDMTRLVQQTVDLIRPQARQQGVQLAVCIPDSPSSPIFADAIRLEQVLLNLVMNALDEMRDGGCLSLKVAECDGRTTVEISDTGNGIPTNIRARVFDPYFTTRSNGSGMGLAVSEKIIRQHGGKIDFDTGPQGTTFQFSLPAGDIDG